MRTEDITYPHYSLPNVLLCRNFEAISAPKFTDPFEFKIVWFVRLVLLENLYVYALDFKVALYHVELYRKKTRNSIANFLHSVCEYKSTRIELAAGYKTFHSARNTTL